MGQTDSNCIEKMMVLKATQSRVWRAISDPVEFGTWFGVKLDGTFAEGVMKSGNLTFKGYEHFVMDMVVEKIKPEHLFSYRWHPYALDTSIDYSQEPMTLVEFKLESVEGGTRLTIVESGFDQIPIERRAEAFRMNDGGWSAQMADIAKYVSQS